MAPPRTCSLRFNVTRECGGLHFAHKQQDVCVHSTDKAVQPSRRRRAASRSLIKEMSGVETLAGAFKVGAGLDFSRRGNITLRGHAHHDDEQRLATNRLALSSVCQLDLGWLVACPCQ